MNKVPNQYMQLNIEEDTVDLKGFFRKIFDKWHWFVISVFIFSILAIVYAKLTPPNFQINARVLVNDDEKGGGLAKQAGALMDLGGLLGSKNSVDNEAEILKTRFLMEQVVRELQLNIVYLQKQKLVKRELYNSPFKVHILKSVDSIKAITLSIIKTPGNKLRIIGGDFDEEISFGQQFNIDKLGTLKVEPTNIPMITDSEYFVAITSIDERVAKLMKDLTVSVANKQVSVIDIGLVYPLPKKGEDILNTIIEKYRAANLSDKNTIADSTYRFIQRRLNVIAVELGDVENDVESFKKRNNLADMTEQGKILVKNTGDNAIELAKAESQVNILTDLENYLKNADKNNRVFPTSLIPQDLVFSNLLNQYNALLVERDKLLLGVTEESPFVKNIDKQVLELRQGILTNIQNTKNSFIVTRNKLRQELNKAEAQISGVPEIEKDYLKLARNQQIKQELYIFLMQKAEETSISKTANISIAKVIDPPKSEVTPISPKKMIIYLAGVMMGLLIPVLLIFGQDFLNTSIKTKEDISQLTHVPIIGEISHNESSENLIVANQGRSAISEQFRALRTNLSFYLKNKDEKVILLTSSMSGEGKSFTAINLGNVFALAGKKVLLMELDLRKPGLSAKLDINNKIGFSNYTISSDIGIDDIIKPLAISNNMFIISSGPLPPNPAETLLSEHTPKLIEELKKRFDYIIMDAPPIGIITDAQLLAPYSDVVLYLVRQKVTQKEQLAIVNDLSQKGKMKNIGLVVNDIVDKYYGYGYGYGNYGENEQHSLLRRVVKKFKG